MDAMRTVLLVLTAAIALAEEPSTWQEITPETERSVGKAKEWLLSAQRRSGAWGLDHAGNDPDDVSCTSMAALALMAGGNTERGGPDSRADDDAGPLAEGGDEWRAWFELRAPHAADAVPTTPAAGPVADANGAR